MGGFFHRNTHVEDRGGLDLLATIAEGAPLTYSVGDQQFSYTFAVTVPNYVRRGTLAMTFERVCGLLQQS